MIPTASDRPISYCLSIQPLGVLLVLAWDTLLRCCSTRLVLLCADSKPCYLTNAVAFFSNDALSHFAQILPWLYIYCFQRAAAQAATCIHAHM